MSDVPSTFNEEKLESELEEMESGVRRAERRASRSAFLKGLASGVVIFLVTTGFVTLLAFFHTNYTSCRSGLESDRQRFAFLIDELYYRWGAVRGIRVNMQGLLPDNSDVMVYQAVFDPNITYSNTEFKGRYFDELSKEAARLVWRWHRREPLSQPYLRIVRPGELLGGIVNKPSLIPPAGSMKSLGPLEPPLSLFPKVANGVLNQILKEITISKNNSSLVEKIAESKTNLFQDIGIWDDKMQAAQFDPDSHSEADPFPSRVCLSLNRLLDGAPGTPIPAGK